MDRSQLPIGVFDSGVGGLTVAREIFRNLPNETILYYGDTARVPYGNKSRDTVIRYSRQITGFLQSEGVKAIVIACNTASALALDAVRSVTDVPVIGVVEPGANAAVRATRSGRIGIIGTSATIRSGIYEHYIRKRMPQAEVFGRACPLFVHLVEEGMIDDSVTREMIHRYLDDMIEKDRIDTLILGCTHYPLLRSVIAGEIGGSYADDKEQPEDPETICLVNPAYTAARELAGLLEREGLASRQPVKMREHRFFVSDDPESFRSFASEILELPVEKAGLKILE